MKGKYARTSLQPQDKEGKATDKKITPIRKKNAPLKCEMSLISLLAYVTNRKRDITHQGATCHQDITPSYLQMTECYFCFPIRVKLL